MTPNRQYDNSTKRNPKQEIALILRNITQLESPKPRFWTTTTKQSKAITLKWNHQFGFITRSQTPDSVITVTTIMAGTPKNELNKIQEEMERDNKEVHAHHGVDLVAFLLRVNSRVLGS